MRIQKSLAVVLSIGMIFAGERPFKSDEFFSNIGFAKPAASTILDANTLSDLLEQQSKIPVGSQVIFIPTPRTPVKFLFGAAVTVIVDPKTGTLTKTEG